MKIDLTDIPPEVMQAIVGVIIAVFSWLLGRKGPGGPTPAPGPVPDLPPDSPLAPLVAGHPILALILKLLISGKLAEAQAVGHAFVLIDPEHPAVMQATSSS